MRTPSAAADPIAELASAHARIEAELQELDRLARALGSGAACDSAARASLADRIAFFDREAARHVMDEEASLFPRLTLPAAAVAELVQEHRSNEAIYLALVSVAGRLARDAQPGPAVLADLALHAGAFSAAWRDHMVREERDAYLDAASLSADELAAIGAEMRLRRR